MADIKTETVEYSANGTTLKGFIAHDASGGPKPGVMVVHEWWGLDDYIRGRATQLAELGYTAMAVDMYGDGKVADNPDDAGAMMNGVLGDMEDGYARFVAGRDALAGHAACDGSRIAAIGYCFGGAMVLHAAKKGLDLAAVVSFHGALGSMHTPSAGEVKAKVLVCHGGGDVLVPDDDISNFKAEMDAAGADYEFISYDGALHGFSNPGATGRGEKFGLPLAYDEAVDKQSWADMQGLFTRVF